MSNSSRSWLWRACAACVALFTAAVSGLTAVVINGHAQQRVTAFVGARIIDGTGAAPVENATLLVRDGRVLAVGPELTVPADADGSSGARLKLGGAVITATTANGAIAEVDELARSRTDWVKIRVDDNLGRGQKMPAAAWDATIRAAHAHGLPVAAHIYYLDDARQLVRAGIDFLAHSVRDRAVDDELISLLKSRGVCLSPTLTRELSAFIYDARPAFFDDPFFRTRWPPTYLRSFRIRRGSAASATTVMRKCIGTLYGWRNKI